MDGEMIWEYVKSSYDSLPLETIARSFMHHVQMLNAINGCNGGDQYHKERGGLHCGIRKAFAPAFKVNNNGDPVGEAIGVETVEVPEDMAEQYELKCAKPIVITMAVSCHSGQSMLL